jgi:hypothetical protein
MPGRRSDASLGPSSPAANSCAGAIRPRSAQTDERPTTLALCRAGHVLAKPIGRIGVVLGYSLPLAGCSSPGQEVEGQTAQGQAGGEIRWHVVVAEPAEILSAGHRIRQEERGNLDVISERCSDLNIRPAVLGSCQKQQQAKTPAARE